MLVFELENGKRPITAVGGLTWHPLVPDNFKRELRPISLDLGADLYVYRKSNKSMVGFAKSEDGAKAGYIPIALVIAQCLDEESEPLNALVAVEIPNSDHKYIYVLIRDGFVLADGDQVGDEDEIRSRFLSDLSVSGWDLLVAPDHWKVNRATSRDLVSFLPKKGEKVKVPAAWKLRPVTVSLKSAIIAAVAVIALGSTAYIGMDLWKQSEIAKKQALAAAQQAAAEESERQAKLTKEPWQDLQRAGPFMAACDSALRGVTAGNWSMGEFQCDGVTLTVKWERAGGWAMVSHLKAMYPAAVLSEDGASALVSTKVQLAAPSGKTGEILQASSARKDALRDAKLRYGITVNIPAKGIAAPPNPADPVGAPSGVPWTSFEIAADSKLSSETTVEALDAPGFRLTRVEGKLKGGNINYQLKGIQYAKP
jgi:hypothetical protein